MNKKKPIPEDIKKKRAYMNQIIPYMQEVQNSEIVKRLEREEELKNK